MVCMADIICATHLYLSQLCVRIFIYLHITKKKKIALVGRQQTPDLGLPPKKHLPETTSRKSELLTVKMGIKVTRLPTRVCVCIEKLHTYTCRSVLLTIYESNPEEWCSPCSSATYSFPERWFAQIYGSEMRNEIIRFSSTKNSFPYSNFLIACLKASDIAVQGNGYSAAKAPKYEAKKDPFGLDFKPFGWGFTLFEAEGIPRVLPFQPWPQHCKNKNRSNGEQNTRSLKKQFLKE